MATQKISKLEAAERQLFESIKIFFERRDVISIHTLACSAHQSLTDLSRQKGIGSNIKDRIPIPEPFKKEFINWLNSPYNFFKHADKDADRELEFNTEVTEWIIVDSIYMLQALMPDSFSAGIAFQTWFFLKHPESLVESKVKQRLMKIRGENYSYDEYERFLELIIKP